MTDDVPTPPPAPPGRPRWDAFRRIAAWAGLLELPVVVVLLIAIGGRLTGDGPDQAESFAIVAVLAGPAVLAGLISGSRFFSLYAGYAERLDPTAELSAEDDARGAAATSGFLGDGLWGALIAGLAGGIPLCIALTEVLNPLAIIMLPLIALVIALAWITGWAAGVVVSLLLSTALGIAVGSSRRRDPGSRLPWILVAVFLPVLLVAVVLSVVGTRFADGRLDGWAALLAVAGIPIDGAEFVLGDPLLWVARIAIWLGVALFAALVVVGTPALLRRSVRG